LYLLGVVCERTRQFSIAERIYKQLLCTLEEFFGINEDVNSASPLESELHRRLLELYTTAQTQIHDSFLSTTIITSNSSLHTSLHEILLPYGTEQLQMFITFHQKRLQLLEKVFPNPLDCCTFLHHFFDLSSEIKISSFTLSKQLTSNIYIYMCVCSGTNCEIFIISRLEWTDLFVSFIHR
jgi:hypothetical protein